MSHSDAACRACVMPLRALTTTHQLLCTYSCSENSVSHIKFIPLFADICYLQEDGASEQVSGKFSTNVQSTLCIVAWTEAEEASRDRHMQGARRSGLRGRDRHETYHCAMISQEIIHLSTYCNGFATLLQLSQKK
ncbi:hypothetical protein EVAR_35716_1 [Eumeta japonica]|uniref:Uncharacterized protein n=1 Tax=Eumeta variegata TaxID=151549 RepID=A0A4C1VG27_EUMVA|nr:hypothetical protein EVAR_35716_1 [Eumeta japonica]